MYKKNIITKILIIVLILSMSSIVFASESDTKEVLNKDILLIVENKEILAELKPVLARTTTYEVTQNGVRLRSNPSLSSTVLGQLNKGDLVNTGDDTTVIADGYEWLLVYSYNHGVWGWVVTDYLEQVG